MAYDFDLIPGFTRFLFQTDRLYPFLVVVHKKLIHRSFSTTAVPLFSCSLLHHRAACDALDNNLNVPLPLTEDTTITLSVGVIECPALDADTNSMEVEQIVIEGGTLTIASDNPVQ